MRYAGASAPSMTALARGVAAPAPAGAPVAGAGLAHLTSARHLAAGVTAIALPAVAVATDGELCVAANAVRQAMAVLLVAPNRHLPPRGAGRAAFGWGNSIRIPASLLKGDRGARFATAPLGRFILEAGIFYSLTPRSAIARDAGPRGRAPRRGSR